MGMTMAYVGAAIAVAGIASSVYGASQGGQEIGSTSRLEFPEETRRLFQDIEEPLLRGSLQEQEALLAPLLGGFRTREAAQQQLGTTRAQLTALTAAKHGGQAAGITDFGPIEESLGGLSPELLESLKQLVLQRGTKIQTVVPAGYGQFLSPSTFTQQSGGGQDEFQTGFQIASGLASVAGAFYNAPKAG